MKKIICFILAFVLVFGAVPLETKASENNEEIIDDMLQQALYLIPEGSSEPELFGSGSATTPESFLPPTELTATREKSMPPNVTTAL